MPTTKQVKLMNRPHTDQEAPKETQEVDTRIDISTADDINVDEDNAVGSPKEGLTAEAPAESEDDTGDADVDESRRKPGR